ncbi:MAG TPA: YdcF family protein [Burkholderiaceae bacterium]|nr:YdcF family protein [Burkholderiaceae bacterium]
MFEALLSGWFWTQLISTLLLPPAGLLLLMVIGTVLLLRERAEWGIRVVIVAWVSLWLGSTPLVGRVLIDSVSNVEPFEADKIKFYKPEDRPQAIVVLGAGRVLGAAEYGGEDLKPRTLARVRYASRIARQTSLPIAVVGGKPEGGRASEAELMNDSLIIDFGMQARWIEGRSRTTWENAREAFARLRADGIERIILVTDLAHIERARNSFQHAGFRVIAAPTGFATSHFSDPKDWLPTAEGLALTRSALHEWGGRVWYLVRSF